MARTIEEIKKEMTDAFLADETLRLQYGFNPSKSFNEQFSKASLESIIFYIIACSIWVLEKLFDKHQEEVSETIAKRAHTLTWYRNKALDFQMGGKLREDILEYDNSELTEDQVEKQKIVTKCSCESLKLVFPTIQVKAVTENGAMTASQFEAFKAYMNEIADAGVKMRYVSKDPDKLGLTMTIMYDPLLMDSEGTLYNEGVKDAVAGYINDYLARLEYNGAFYPNLLESYLMACVGVKVANIDKAYYKEADESQAQPIDGLKHIPSSGAFVFDNSIGADLSNPINLTITYLPFNEDEQ